MKNKLFHSKNKQEFFHEIFYVGFKDAVGTSLGIFKIMILVSLLMAILNYFGVVEVIFERNNHFIQHDFIKSHASG